MNKKAPLFGLMIAIVLISVAAFVLQPAPAAEKQSNGVVLRASTFAGGGGASESAGMKAWQVIGGAPAFTQPQTNPSRILWPGFLPASDDMHFPTAAQPARWPLYP